MNEVTNRSSQNGIPSLVQVRLDQTNYPRIKNMPYEQVVKDLAGVVGTAFMYTGRFASEQDVAFIAGNLYTELMTDEQGLGMGNISIEEIGRCVKRSVLGQGREMFGISVASLYAIIADYCKGEGHLVSKQIDNMTQEQRVKELKQSAVYALIESAADAMVKSNRIK